MMSHAIELKYLFVLVSKVKISSLMLFLVQFIVFHIIN